MKVNTCHCLYCTVSDSPLCPHQSIWLWFLMCWVLDSSSEIIQLNWNQPTKSCVFVVLHPCFHPYRHHGWRTLHLVWNLAQPLTCSFYVELLDGIMFLLYLVLARKKYFHTSRHNNLHSCKRWDQRLETRFINNTLETGDKEELCSEFSEHVAVCVTFTVHSRFRII